MRRSWAILFERWCLRMWKSGNLVIWSIFPVLTRSSVVGRSFPSLLPSPFSLFLLPPVYSTSQPQLRSFIDQGGLQVFSEWLGMRDRSRMKKYLLEILQSRFPVTRWDLNTCPRLAERVLTLSSDEMPHLASIAQSLVELWRLAPQKTFSESRVTCFQPDSSYETRERSHYPPASRSRTTTSRGRGEITREEENALPNLKEVPPFKMQRRETPSVDEQPKSNENLNNPSPQYLEFSMDSLHSTSTESPEASFIPFGILNMREERVSNSQILSRQISSWTRSKMEPSISWTAPSALDPIQFDFPFPAHFPSSHLARGGVESAPLSHPKFDPNDQTSLLLTPAEDLVLKENVSFDDSLILSVKLAPFGLLGHSS